jgi:2,4-dienoyl-CoA reductase-like NADH-dependent reductase (Old Yellow Enzyme family)
MSTPAGPDVTDDPLWQPLAIGAVEVPHRVMISGHTLLYGVDGLLSQRHVDYYHARAAGGAALVITEQQAAHPSGANYLQGCRAYDPRAVSWYRKLSDTLHPHGTKVFVQLFCGGAQGSGTMYIDEWRPLWAPSAIASTQFHEQPAEMTADDIRSVIDGFALSARHSQDGGCDGVEIHAAHSQLLGAFLSPALNHRTDAYGGSIENRCRIVLETGEAVRRATGDRFASGLRLSIYEGLSGGAGIDEAQFLRQLEIFRDAGLFDFYDLSAGGYFAKHVAVTPMTSDLPDAFLAPAAKRARSLVGGRGTVFVVGRVLDIPTAREVIASGSADMVAMTRALMADPETVNKARAGRRQDTVRCVGAAVCTRRLGENNAIVCVVNPSLGREATMGRGTMRKAALRKRIAVVGAGPAGMRFAGTAAARGHQVTLYEAAPAVGGRLRLLAGLPARSRWQDAIGNLSRWVEHNDVTLRIDTRFDERLLDDGAVDAVVLATGARFDCTGYSAYRPERPGIPGADAPHVIGLDTAIERTTDDPGALGPHLVIVDDGYDELSAGLAERVARTGATVHIVTPRMWWGEGLARTYDIAHVLPRLRETGVRIVAQRFVERIDAQMVKLYDLWQPSEQATIEADTIVLALGRRTVSPEVTGATMRIGDCLAPRSLEAVIFEGEELARAM